MPTMRLNRNHRLISVKGHSVQFLKGEDTYVPAQLVQEAIAVGGELVDGESPFKEEVALPPIPEGVEREEKIIATMIEMQKRNDRNDFTGSGLPNAKVIEGVLGFAVYAEERNRLWEALLVRQSDARGA
jgi:hypothetical protein